MPTQIIPLKKILYLLEYMRMILTKFLIMINY